MRRCLYFLFLLSIIGCGGSEPNKLHDNIKFGDAIRGLYGIGHVFDLREMTLEPEDYQEADDGSKNAGALLWQIRRTARSIVNSVLGDPVKIDFPRNSGSIVIEEDRFVVRGDVIFSIGEDVYETVIVPFEVGVVPAGKGIYDAKGIKVGDMTFPDRTDDGKLRSFRFKN